MTHTDFKDWPALAANLIPAIKQLHRGAPEVMKGFRDMGAAAHGAGMCSRNNSISCRTL